jgi:amidase
LNEDMRLDEYSRYDATDLAALVRTGQVTPTELASLAAQAAAAVNSEINAIIGLYDDPSQGAPGGPLHCVPTLRKDLTPEAGPAVRAGQPAHRGIPRDNDECRGQTGAGGRGHDRRPECDT